MSTSTTSTSKRPVRLRKPQRMQVEMKLGCVDDLVGKNHQVRVVQALVATLDLSGFAEPIKAREGNAGRDSTDPALLVGLWVYGNIRAIGSARELARRCLEDRALMWLCGGVGVNHHLLSDFRVEHGKALDELFSSLLALLVKKGLVKIRRISQDGVRVRAGAGASSFRRQSTLEQLLKEAKEHVEILAKQIDNPEQSAAAGSAKAAAVKRAAQDRLDRLEQAIAELPELKKKQEEAAKKAGNGERGKQIAAKQPRVSTTDADARVMKMPNGGFNPAFNVQLATDTESRAIVGVEVSNEGSDSAGLSEPLRKQVEDRTGQKIEQHLLDGGYVKTEDIEQAHQQGVELFMPPKSAHSPKNKGHELDPKPGDSEALLEWKARMRSEQGKEIYKQRASTSEPVNADLRCERGLEQFRVRGLPKARCVTLWCALAYNVMHFAAALMS